MSLVGVVGLTGHNAGVVPLSGAIGEKVMS